MNHTFIVRVADAPGEEDIPVAMSWLVERALRDGNIRVISIDKVIEHPSAYSEDNK
jgi:hypothetical protein